MKKCPYCAELIQDEAIKCRYCQSSLSPGPGLSSKDLALLPPEPPPQPTKPGLNPADLALLPPELRQEIPLSQLAPKPLPKPAKKTAIWVLAGLVAAGVAIGVIATQSSKEEAHAREIDLVRSLSTKHCKDFPWKAKKFEKYNGVAVWHHSWGFIVRGNEVCRTNGATHGCADVPVCDVIGNPEELFAD